MAELLDIDAHGRVTPGGDPARRALADRAGRFELLPTTPDLLVARRLPTAGGTRERPRVAMCGDVASFPVADLLAFLHQTRRSGVLVVAADGAERALVLKDGEVRSAQSSMAGERLGEVAIKLGFVTEVQLVDAARSVGEGPIGKALTERGHISASDLWRCIHEQVATVFHALLLAQQGVFWLLDQELGDRLGAPLAVTTQSLLMDGIRRIDEMSLFQGRIPGPGAYLRRREPKRPRTLKAVEQQLLALVDGQRTVAQVATAAHLNEFDAIKALYHLAEAGYLEAQAVPAPQAGPPGDRLEAILLGMNELLRTVAAAVAPEQRPAFLASVRSHLADERAPFAPLFRGMQAVPDGALDPAVLRANLTALRGPTAQRLEVDATVPRLLMDALREMLFFYLYLAGERISREADEQLGTLVRRQLTRLETLAGG